MSPDAKDLDGQPSEGPSGLHGVESAGGADAVPETPDANPSADLEDSSDRRGGALPDETVPDETVPDETVSDEGAVPRDEGPAEA